MTADAYLSSQDVLLSLPCPDGLPASATVTLKHACSASYDVAAAAITLPTTAAVVASAGYVAGSRTIPVDAHTLTQAGREYLITSTTGERRVVEISGIASGALTIEGQRGIDITLAAGSTIVDHVLTHDAGTLDEEDRWRAEWLLTWADGSVTGVTQAFDVVPRVFRLDLTLDDLVDDAPDLARRVTRRRWPRLLRGAEREQARFLRRRGMRPARVIDTRPFESWALLLITLRCYEDSSLGATADEARIERLRQDVADARAELLAGSWWYDADDDGRVDASADGSPDELDRGAASSRMSVG